MGTSKMEAEVPVQEPHLLGKTCDDRSAVTDSDLRASGGHSTSKMEAEVPVQEPHLLGKTCDDRSAVTDSDFRASGGHSTSKMEAYEVPVQKLQLLGKISLPTAATTSMTIIIHDVEGKYLLGPKEFPMGVSAGKLEEELIANGQPRDHLLQLVFQDQVLDRDKSIQASEGSADPLMVLCVFSKAIHIDASWGVGWYRGYMKKKFSVRPYSGSRSDGDTWMTRKSPTILDRSGSEFLQILTHGNIQLEHVLASMVDDKQNGSATRMSPQDWEKFQTFMNSASDVRFVKWGSWESDLGAHTGFRAVTDGHQIEYEYEECQN